MDRALGTSIGAHKDIVVKEETLQLEGASHNGRQLDVQNSHWDGHGVSIKSFQHKWEFNFFEYNAAVFSVYYMNISMKIVFTCILER